MSSIGAVNAGVPGTTAGGDDFVTLRNPFPTGSTAQGNDAVFFYADGFIDFVMDNKEFSVGPDGAVWVPDGSDWAADANPSPAVLARFEALRALTPAGVGGAAAANAAGTVKVPSQQSGTVAKDRVATGAVRSAQGPAETDPLAALKREISENQKQIAELKQENAAQERRIAESEHQNAAETKAREAGEARDAEATKKPFKFRWLLELLEVVGRIFVPILSFVSLCVRAIKIAYKLAKGEEINWKQEGIRALGDAVGSLGLIFPPAALFTGIASAAIYEGSNLFMGDSQGIRGGQSEFLGGINELFFDKGEVRNAQREAVADVFTRRKKNDPKDAPMPLRAGDKNDDGVKPLAPETEEVVA